MYDFLDLLHFRADLNVCSNMGSKVNAPPPSLRLEVIVTKEGAIRPVQRKSVNLVYFGAFSLPATVLEGVRKTWRSCLSCLKFNGSSSNQEGKMAMFTALIIIQITPPRHLVSKSKLASPPP